MDRLLLFCLVVFFNTKTEKKSEKQKRSAYLISAKISQTQSTNRKTAEEEALLTWRPC